MSERYTQKQIDLIVDLRSCGFSWQEVADEYRKVYPNSGRNAENLRAVFRRSAWIQDMQDADFARGQILTNRRLHNRTVIQGRELRLLADTANLSEDFVKQFSALVEQLKASPPFKIRAAKKRKRNKISRTVFAHVSDLHLGAEVKAGEVGYVNEFNWKIAARRLALYTKNLLDYKLDHRKESDLVLAINGDILAGVIHSQENNVQAITLQYAGALQLFSQMIAQVAASYQRVYVVLVGGNHDRMMHKANKGRQLEAKWDNYVTMIGLALRQVFDSSPRVVISIPESPYAMIEAQGHNYLVTHTDTVIELGQPQNLLNVKSISQQIDAFNAGQTARGLVTADAVLGGHVHCPCIILLNSGVYLCVNGSLTGIDPFHQSVGVFSMEPAQQFFEATEQHTVGDVRIVQLRSADSDASLDEILFVDERIFGAGE